LERKGRKWLRPRASAAAGDDEEGQQLVWHHRGMAQRHGDGEATRTHERKRESYASGRREERERSYCSPDG